MTKLNDRNQFDASVVVAGLAAAGLAALCMALVLYVLAAFACLLLTLMCLAAWNKRLPIGQWIIEPDEARAFVGCGAIGAIGLVCFVAFANGFLGLMWSGGLHLPDGWSLHCAILGYIAGSLGFSWHCAKEYETKLVIEDQRLVSTPSPKEKLQRSFAFASWDDEETRP
jgi:hypothetical protein